MRTGSGKRSARACTGTGVHVTPEVAEHGPGPLVELGGAGPRGSRHWPDGQAERPACALAGSGFG